MQSIFLISKQLYVYHETVAGTSFPVHSAASSSGSPVVEFVSPGLSPMPQYFFSSVHADSRAHIGSNFKASWSALPCLATSDAFRYYCCHPDGAAQGKLDEFELSAVNVQRFVRKRQGRTFGGSNLAVGKRSNKIRVLRRWIPKAVDRWKRRRLAAGLVVFEFLRDARLTQNIKAIYRFRRRVIR